MPRTVSKQARCYNNVFGVAPLVLLVTAAVTSRNKVPAWSFMWALAFAVFAGLKWITWWRTRYGIPHSAKRSIAYLVGWPGMDAEAFLDSRLVVTQPPRREWFWAASKTGLGAALIWVFAKQPTPQHALLRGWIGLFGLIFLLHFGSFHLISLFWRAVGIKADPIMAEPIKSRTLSQFWGKRWNLGFRQLAYDLIFRPLHRHIGVAAAGFLVFLLSGLVHDLVISVPARGGYGLPTGYFVIQGLGVAFERTRAGRVLGLQRGLRGWMLVIVSAAGPAFWLFHPPFVLRVIVPFMHAIHAI